MRTLLTLQSFCSLLAYPSIGVALASRKQWVATHVCEDAVARAQSGDLGENLGASRRMRSEIITRTKGYGLRALALSVVLAGTSSAGSQPIFYEEVPYTAPESFEVYRPPLFTKKVANLICSASFVSSVATRIPTNENQLEFWCRDPSKPIDLKWERIPTPSAILSQAQIANFKGTLIEERSRQAFVNGRWIPLAEAFPRLANSPIQWQRFGAEGELATVTYREECRAYVLSSAKYDFGAFPALPSYARIDNGHVYFVDRSGLSIAPLTPVQNACEPLSASLLKEGVGQAYGGINWGGGVVLGGSNNRGNANLYLLKGNEVTEISYSNSESVANEHYAYTYQDGSLLVGLYPSGNFMRLDEGGQFTYHGDMTPTLPTDWRSDNGMLYREAQAAVSSYGILFTGLYPWGEIVQHDTLAGRTSRDRLFTHPERKDRLPYLYESGNLFRRLQAGDFDEDIKAGRIVLDKEQGGFKFAARKYGLFESAWAQRITTLAVFSGRVCAATGSMGGTVYNPDLHNFMTRAQADDYGTIYCAELPNHTMYSDVLTGTHSLKFTVSESITISMDGKVVAETPITAW